MQINVTIMAMQNENTYSIQLNNTFFLFKKHTSEYRQSFSWHIRFFCVPCSP